MRSMTPLWSGASRCSAASSGRARSAAAAVVALTGRLPGHVQARERALAVLARLAAHLAHVGDALEAGDLALALEPGRVVGRKAADERGDAVAQLQREVRGRGAHELAHVLDGDRVVGGAAGGVLGFAHFVVLVLFASLDGFAVVVVFVPPSCCCELEPLSTGTICRRASIRACTAVEIAASSPINQ